jgi:hypothetical protein
MLVCQTFPMNEQRITLSRAELIQKLYLGITVALARRSSTRASLLNPRDTEKAERNRDAAAHQLAEVLADGFERSKHEVTRPAIDNEGEAILTRLRDQRYAD